MSKSSDEVMSNVNVLGSRVFVGSSLHDLSKLQYTTVVIHYLRHYIPHLGVTGVCSSVVGAGLMNVVDTGFTPVTHISF